MMMTMTLFLTGSHKPLVNTHMETNDDAMIFRESENVLSKHRWHIFFTSDSYINILCQKTVYKQTNEIYTQKNNSFNKPRYKDNAYNS